ncbi:yrdF, partial [Symbiodinium microadriaticum]
MNREGELPNAPGRKYFEADLAYNGGHRGAERSNEAMSDATEKRIIIPPELTSVEAIYEYLGQSLEFPEYYGGNLDALYDCATRDICEPVCVVWPKDWTGGNPYLYLLAMRVLGVLLD